MRKIGAVLVLAAIAAVPAVSAVLSNADRKVVRHDIGLEWSTRFEATSLTKAELKAAVDSADQWVSDNKVSFNNALPAAAQAGLTNAQKAELLVFVASKRFDLGI